MESNNNKFITKETIQRLLRDVRTLMKNPLTENGIYYIHDDEDILKGYAMIIGPKDTPYFGGYYFFEFDYPYDFPFSPPKVTYRTNDGVTRFNPNLYKCGKVCVSILNTWSGDKWSACQTISTILLTLCSLLNEEPFLNEPGQTKNSIDFKNYQESITYMNIKFSICKIISMMSNSNNSVISTTFMAFYPIVKELFIKNYDAITEIVKNKITSPENKNKLIVSLYGMNTFIDYNQCKEMLEELNYLIKDNK
jgi:ubiquitin-protein ligase